MILQVRSALEGQLEGKLELMLAVQSPTWSSEGHLGALGEQFEGPSGDQVALGVRLGRVVRSNLALKRPGRAAQAGVQSPTWQFMCTLT